MIVRDFLKEVCADFESHQDGAHTLYMARLRGYRVGAIDTSKLGGFWLDWFCFAEWSGVLVEVKTPEAIKAPGKSLRPGELWTVNNLPYRTTVLSTDEEVIALFDILLGDLGKHKGV